MKTNKWLYGWKLYINYGGGWEYETFEETREDYKVNRKAYAENCQYPQRWSRGRELNPLYVAPVKSTRKTVAEFIREHKADIDAVIKRKVPNALLTDEERRKWIINDEGLYVWARNEGVKI